MLIEEDARPACRMDHHVRRHDVAALTFFIMLVSMSDIRQDGKYQGVADSLHDQFGYDATLSSCRPGRAYRIKRHTTGAGQTW